MKGEEGRGHGGGFGLTWRLDLDDNLWRNTSNRQVGRKHGDHYQPCVIEGQD